MKQKNKILLAVLAVVAVLCVGGVAVLLSYGSVDHSKFMSKTQVTEYNTAITAAARGYNSITKEEFVLIDTVSKTMGSHTEVTYRVYRLPEGKQLSDYLSLTAGDVPADFAPEHVGNGTARLVNGTLDRIIVTIAYFK